MRSYRFQKIMDQDFAKRMIIPANAAVKIFKKKAEVVTLEGPSGNQWLVRLSKVAGQLYLKEGWKEFVEAHYAEEGDVLIFTYCRSSRLSVLIFDRSGCERESSYFVKNKNHILTNGCQTKLVNRKRQLPDALECSSPKLACDANPPAQVISVDDEASSFRVESSCTRFNMRLSSRKKKFKNEISFGFKNEKSIKYLHMPSYLNIHMRVEKDGKIHNKWKAVNCQHGPKIDRAKG